MSSATLTLPPCLNPQAQQPRPRGAKRRKAKSLARRCKAFMMRHTWVLPLAVCCVVAGAYLLNPTPSNPVHQALFLSYPLPRDADAPADAPTMYGKGAKDFYFVAYYVAFLTFTREFLMQRMLRPLAVRCGIRKGGKQTRFVEQVYTAIYFAVFGPFGMYVMSQTPVWYFNTRAMYENFPHREHDGLFKTYYLLQASYWAQQAIVLLLQQEKPRKDYKELVGHHIITLALIWLSYRFHFASMGLAVYITHDISDFFLATSKTLNYLDSPLIGPYYAFFVVVWTYLRHYINLRILWSILTEFNTVGPYELNWDTQQYKCWISQIITFGLLASLQAINLFWLFLILRIGYRFVTANVAVDERSDAEDDDEEQEEHRHQHQQRKEDGAADGLLKQHQPDILVNGEPVEAGGKEAAATGVQTRSKVRSRKA
ncbi:TLC domain-containing protein [Lineolata rhizophorae]|uniref:TLC domain-containing protein n=1 Tax=Lineolata rhizophorae TaxID=578093 RepID=A0A6A6NMK7_9PEZI|nr:TLC domain-containing protein [Lineolata rhizophorae]